MGKGALGIIFIVFFVCFVIIKYLIIGGAAAFKAVFEEGENSVQKAMSPQRMARMEHDASAPYSATEYAGQLRQLSGKPKTPVTASSLQQEVMAELENVVRFSLKMKGFILPDELEPALVDAADSICLQLASHGYSCSPTQGLRLARSIAVRKCYVTERMLLEKDL